MPDAESGDVYVSGYYDKVFHDDEKCPNLADEYRSVGRHKIEATYRLCRICEDGNDRGGAVEQDCPVCGEEIDIQLGLHLSATCSGVDGDD